MVTCEACTSIRPVFMFGFTCDSFRATTSPISSTTYSFRKVSPTAKASAEMAGLITICTIPVRSRRSTKMSPPRSRLF